MANFHRMFFEAHVPAMELAQELRSLPTPRPYKSQCKDDMLWKLDYMAMETHSTSVQQLRKSIFWGQCEKGQGPEMSLGIL
jgi:hypothetical protein